jgi:tetratricopeptide (TPR) repeat protein
MFRSPGSVEARIAALLDDAQRQLESGQYGKAVAMQGEAARQARKLAAMLPDDVRVRQGLASVLYNLASMLVSAGDMTAAVPELDDCLDLYGSLAGAVAGTGLLCADVRARRGLARAALGRAASAIVDTDAAVLAYITATGGDLDHPLRRDLARVLSVNAAVLARQGDPGLAVASADVALACYVAAAEQSPGDRLPAEDGGYLRTAATVSALFNLASGRLAEGLYPALVIVSNLEPDEARKRLESVIVRVDGLLARSEEDNRPIEDPVGTGRKLAEFLIVAVRDRGVAWLPDGVPVPGQMLGASWPDGDLPPTLEEALGRHASGPRDAGLAAGMAPGQPRELVWTPSMRWPGRHLTCGLRLAELAIETLPLAYADGLRLALDAHALLAAGHQRRKETDTPAPGECIPAWRRLLAETAAACRAAGDDALAEDLAGLETAIG